MNNRHSRGTSLAVFAALAFASVGQAQLRSSSGKLIVLSPENLPDAARLPGDGFFLRSTPKGDLLYVEQQKGSQLAIFDVTEPGNIKLKTIAHIAAAAPYDFIRPLNATGELVRFRDGKTAAVLDMTKEDEPQLVDASSLKAKSKTIVLDDTSSFALTEPYKYTAPVPHDYAVVDTASEAQPETVTTIKQVAYEVTNKNTGTTFLFNPDGLTVIRRVSVEDSAKSRTHQMDAH